MSNNSQTDSSANSPDLRQKVRILQIFNRYLEYGGEEGSVLRIGQTLRERYRLKYFDTSSKELLGGPIKSLHAVFAMHSNREVSKRLEGTQDSGKYNLWLIHNVFPTISPVAYEIAFQKQIPVVQYLHNYRLSCVNGFFLNHGEPCTRCIEGNFWPALQTACWQNSHLKSGVMGSVLRRVRRLNVFEKVTHWIAISEAQKRLHVRMGIPEQRISVLPHFYVPKQPVPAPSDGNDVLYIGRLSREKGVDMLLRAWKLLGGDRRCLKIVGEGPDRERLEQIVAAESIPGVEFTGFVAQGHQDSLWQNSRVCVVPSVWEEPFGMVVLESWSRGVPVIASDCGGLAEIVDHEINGLKVPPRDVQALASCLLRALSNPKMCRAMAQAGSRKLQSDFSKELWLKRICPILDSVVYGQADSRRTAT